jgi:hypothetical protein
MSEKEKIPRKAYELPLLRSLMERGGAVVPDVEFYRAVSEKTGFADQEAEFDIVHAREKWTYTLQWVRHTLVQQGDMDGSKRGTWAITEQGRKRVAEASGLTPP